MKRIFHIISHYDLGGAERVAINIARSQSSGFEYHLVEVIRGRSAFSRRLMDEMDAAGIRYHRSPVPVLISFHYVFERLAALLFPLWFVFLYRKYRPDVLHSHTDIPDLSVYLFRRLFRRLSAGSRLVRTIHNTRLWNGQQRVGRRVEQMFQEAGACVAISESTAESYERAYGQRPPIVFNGVGQPAAVACDGVVAGRLNVVFAGRFDEQKGIGVLVETVTMLAQDDRYFFHIFGSGPLQGLVDQLRRLPNVSVGGPLYGLSSRLASFDYVFMPSLFEGLATLSIEASMSGVPVVGSDCPGLRDTLPPDWPLKVAGNRPEQYVHLFRDVLPAGRRSEWACQAREFALQHFTLQQMQQKYELFYLSGAQGVSEGPLHAREAVPHEHEALPHGREAAPHEAEGTVQ